MSSKLKLREGENLNRNPNCPVIDINMQGKNTYLWIGNDAENDKFCFATVSGKKRLEKFANAILEAIR